MKKPRKLRALKKGCKTCEYNFRGTCAGIEEFYGKTIPDISGCTSWGMSFKSFGRYGDKYELDGTPIIPIYKVKNLKSVEKLIKGWKNKHDKNNKILN